MLVLPPLRVEVRRGRLVESSHRVHVAVVDADGQVVRSWGDPERRTHPRSAIKPIQALPLVETGAADAFGLGDVELTLACASHNGETDHVATVETWLGRIGCSPHDLECGAQAGRGPSPSANNCSGKHAGFLTVARHLGVPTAGYTAIDHPVQERVTAALGDLADVDPDPDDAGTDGCGIPVHPVPLSSIALAGARFAAPPEHWTADRREACRRLAAAMVANPWYVAGSGRLDTDLLRAGNGEVLTKAGAEGVQLAALPRLGFGVAVKVEDGAPRASEPVLGHVLSTLHPGLALEGVFGPRRRLTNHAGTDVGEVRVHEN